MDFNERIVPQISARASLWGRLSRRIVADPMNREEKEKSRRHERKNSISTDNFVFARAAFQYYKLFKQAVWCPFIGSFLRSSFPPPPLMTHGVSLFAFFIHTRRRKSSPLLATTWWKSRSPAPPLSDFKTLFIYLPSVVRTMLLSYGWSNEFMVPFAASADIGL